MLVSFSVENYLQYENKITFDLAHPGDYPLYTHYIENGVIQKSILYDNIIAPESFFGYALFDLVFHISDYKYPVFYPSSDPEKVSIFEYEFLFSGIQVIYRYKKKNRKIIAEMLAINGIDVFKWVQDKTISCYYDILYSGLSLEDKNSFVPYCYENRKCDNSMIDNIFSAFVHFVNNMLYVDLTSVNTHIGFIKDLDDEVEYFCSTNKLKQLQGWLDSLGIFCKLRVGKVRGKKTLIDSKTNLEFTESCSSGTLRLFYLFYWLQKVIDSGQCSLFYINAFDSHFHILLAKKLYKIIREMPEQIICSATYNTALISYSTLRPDFYFCITKDKIQTLEQAAGRKLTLAHNLEKIFRNKFRNDGNLS